MSELFKGAVLYKPSLSEVLNLRTTLDFINNNPININEVFNKHTTPHWWEAKIDWVALSAELDSYIGWRWGSYGKRGEYRYAEKRWWVNSVSEILDMLNIDEQCYISPTQARAIKHAQKAHQQIKELKMNLIQQVIEYKYNTFELLESMIKLSRINIDRFQHISTDRVSQLSSGMTSFNTGRQTGKSTAIARYLKENDDVIVVSPTKAMQKTMAQELQSVNKFNLCVTDFNNSRIFKGIQGEFDLIFDECDLDNIFHCLWCLGEYPGIKIRSIVKVGL